ncbi:MAG: tryptophan synthase subunit alpha [Pyrinomonadaceae bacterium]|nr:tryptophan synthase subunit alpha [Pyrinomonadaceae bacterium]
MSRIAEVFAQLKREGKKGFIPFIVAGDPDLVTTLELLVELANSEAAVIELGVPFSDPMADGRVIQRASERALQHGFGLAAVLETAAKARQRTNVPIVLFSYYNPLMQYGVGNLIRDAKEAGIDGVLVTDLTLEESGEFANALSARELDLIFLVAPTSTDIRLQAIAKRATGFIYAVSRAGVTGEQGDVSAAAENLVRRVRRCSDLPVAVGFGISSGEQVAKTWAYADAAVVGSAIVAEIERRAGKPDIVQRVGEFARRLVYTQADHNSSKLLGNRSPDERK